VRSLALLFAVTACGLDVCARSEAAARDFPKKVAACQQIPTPAFDMSACSSSVESCSDADLKVITGYFDCLEGLPTCTVANEFTAAVLACANRMTTVSSGCFSQ
jgi:hypothetical protein